MLDICPEMIELSSRTGSAGFTQTKAILVTIYTTCTYKARQDTKGDIETQVKEFIDLAVDSLA